MKLRTRIFFTIVAVSLVPLLTVTIYLSSNTLSRIRTDTQMRQFSLQDGCGSVLSLFLEKVGFISNECYDSAIQEILSESGITEKRKYDNRIALENSFRTKLDLYGILQNVASVCVYLDDGTAYEIKGDNSFSQLFKVTESLKERLDVEYRLSAIVPSENDGELVFVRCINSITDGGRRLGYLTVCFSKSEISQFFEDYMAIMPGSRVAVYNCFGDRLLWLGEDVEGVGKTSKREIVIENGSIRISFEDVDSVTFSALFRLRNIMLIVAFIGSLLILAVSYMVADFTVRPIDSLRKGIDKIRDGEYTATLPMKGSTEIVELGHAYRKMADEINNLINRVYAKELSEKEALIAALNAQINPHFLYNTLDMIKSMAEIDGAYDIADIVRTLSAFFRYTAKSEEMVVTVDEELENLSNYMKIMNARFGRNLNCTILADRAAGNLKIVRMCLQPLVENSIKHGLGKSEDIGYIVVSVRKDGEWLKIVVSDNGVGMNLDELKGVEEILSSPDGESPGGLGLRNILRRLRLCCGDSSELKVYNNEGKGMSVEIILPARE